MSILNQLDYNKSNKFTAAIAKAVNIPEPKVREFLSTIIVKDAIEALGSDEYFESLDYNCDEIVQATRRLFNL